MTVYKKQIMDYFLVPYLPENTFLNNVSGAGAIQALAQRDVLPYTHIAEDLSLILPEREDEGESGVGEGKNETVILEKQFKVGAGSVPNRAFDFLMIARLNGKITVTHQVAEIWTILAKAKADITHASYFCFDVIDINHDHFQYQAWFNVDGGAAPAIEDCYDPVDGVEDGINKITTQGKRELIEMDIQAAGDAASVATIIAAAIDTKANVAAAAVTTTVTVTNAQLGSVIDAYDVGSGCTLAVTTQGRFKFVIELDADSDDIGSHFGFHAQRNKGAKDTIYELTGISIAEHTLEVEEGEVMNEDVSYMIAGIKETYGALTMLTKPRSYFGTEWTKGLSPNSTKYKNHGWHTCNENHTLTLNGVDLDVVWQGWKILTENDLSHDFNGGGDYASKVNYNARGCTMTLSLMPEGHEFFEMQRQHWKDYGGAGLAHALLLQLKTIMKGTGDNVFAQFDCDICRVLPFEESIKADNSGEKYDIDLVPAPGATFSYTIQSYLPNYAFGLGGR